MIFQKEFKKIDQKLNQAFKMLELIRKYRMFLSALRNPYFHWILSSEINLNARIWVKGTNLPI
ncbi:hypothetical protein AVL50_15340 [Flammeovirga sp. SJP92]|nr:hypothetical protein AVL50_15340 [Flammeovirga sp. SJP92]